MIGRPARIVRGSVAVLLTLGLVGCAVVLGIKDRPVVDGADAAAETGVDPCAHAQPPPPTGLDDDPATEGQYVVAAHGIDLAPSPGETLGYDLDDTCTCDPSPTRHDGGPSCTSTVSRNCDQEGGAGIDNAFGQLTFAKLLSGAGGVGSQTEGTLCGRSTLLAVIGKYNGRANDSDVTFGFVLSPGLKTPHEDAEAPSSCNNGPEHPLPTVYAPRWDGTDRWSTDTTFVVTNSLTPTQLISGYVRDWVLVARSSEGQPLRLPFGPIVGDARGTILRANLALGDAGLRIVDGQVAARLTTASIIPAISNVPLGGKGGYICPNNANAELFKAVVASVCNGRDITTDPLRDFTGASCDSVSSAVRFFGDPAQMLKPLPPFDAGASECPDVDASCE